MHAAVTLQSFPLPLPSMVDFMYEYVREALTERNVWSRRQPACLTCMYVREPTVAAVFGILADNVTRAAYHLCTCATVDGNRSCNYNSIAAIFCLSRVAPAAALCQHKRQLHRLAERPIWTCLFP